MSTAPTAATAGAPFAVMLRGALAPSAVCGVLAVVVAAIGWGPNAAISAALGGLVALVFFATGMILLSRLVRSANPYAFLAVGMAVYLGQVLGLLIFMIVLRDKAWIDGPALGLAALAVTIVWQGFAMRAFRRARLPIYDEPTGDMQTPAR